MSESSHEQWILVVDDDDFFRNLIAELLTAAGHSVLGARNAQEATRALAAKRPALVIVDFRLPGEDGVSWITRMREAGWETPVVFLSGAMLDAFTFTKLRNLLKVALILQKPIVPELFLEQLEGLLPNVHRGAAGSVERRQTLDGVDEYSPQQKSLSAELDQMDEALYEAKRQCALELPEMVRSLAEAIRMARDTGHNKTLLLQGRDIAHRIKGTAGTCGFARVSEDAARVERLLLDVEPDDNTMQEIIWLEIIRHIADAEAAAAELAESARAGIIDRPISTAGKRRSAHAVLLITNSDDAIDMSMHLSLNIAEAIVVNSMRDALVTLRTQPFDAVIIDQHLCGEEDVLDFTRSMRTATGRESLPTAFIAGDKQLFGAGDLLFLGCSMRIERPLKLTNFEESVQNLLSLYVPCLPRILTVDDDPILSGLINRTLSKENMIVHELNDPIMILDTVQDFKPDIILLDVIMPGLSGYDVCRLLRQDKRYAHLIIMFLTSKSDAQGRNSAFQAGGNDFLAKPLVTAELIRRVKAQVQWSPSIRDRIDRDPETGLLRRESLETALSRMVASASEDRHPLSVCVIEPVIETSGNVAVEKVLSQLGGLLQVRFRAEDVRGRLEVPGMAALLMLLIERQPREAVLEAMQLLIAEFEAAMQNLYDDSITGTISFGVAELFRDSDDYSEVLQIALLRSRNVETSSTI